MISDFCISFWTFAAADDSVPDTTACAFWAKPYYTIGDDCVNNLLQCCMLKDIIFSRDAISVPSFLLERVG